MGRWGLHEAKRKLKNQHEIQNYNLPTSDFHVSTRGSVISAVQTGNLKIKSTKHTSPKALFFAHAVEIPLSLQMGFILHCGFLLCK